MDPVGPWSAYASYNRLAAAGAQTGTGDLHHHLTAATAAAAASGASPSTTTAQILPGTFLSPPPVSYETVFSPLFHANTKSPAHYVSQHRTTKQTTDSDYHQSAFFEQGASWQQNSPFGILPHESVVPTTTTTTTTSKTANYENFNAHFAAAQNHLNSQLVAAKAAVSAAVAARAQSPQQLASTTATSKSNFFQVQQQQQQENSSKSFSSSNNQSCIVSSPSSVKEYRVPQRNFVNSPNPASVAPPPTTTRIVQNKQPHSPTTKTNKEESQSSPISFSIDTNRLNFNNNNKRNFQHNYRYQGNDDFRPNSATTTTNGPDCNNVVVPRRPSPLQARSQASPLGHAPSPAYPMYNSPMNSISSPQQTQQVTPPLDASVPRSQNNVTYPSVITRVLNSNEKNFDRFERANNNQPPQQQQQQQQVNCWEERQNRKYNVTQFNNVVEGRQYFDNNQTLQDLSSCRGDPMSIVKNLQQQSCQLTQIDIKQEIKPPIKRRRSLDKSDRIPPPAHSSQTPQQTTQQNGSYFDFDRWNLPSTTKIFHQQQTPQQHQSLMVHHPPPPLPYFAPFIPHPHPEFQSMELQTNYEHYQQSQHSHQQSLQTTTEDHPKVVVPNIEEELNFLSQGTVKIPTNKLIGNSKTNNKNGQGSGFMSSYLKFLQGERDTSPPPPTTRYTSKKTQQNWIKKEETIPETNGNISGIKPQIPTPQSLLPPLQSTRLSTHGDPQDDPRYFPLPKERKRDSFDSSDDGISSGDDYFGNKKSSSIVIKSTNKFTNVKNKKTRNKSTIIINDKKRKKETIKDVIEKKDIENIPRRESVKRAAKEKNNLKNLIKTNDDDAEEPPEFQDSDSDPAWTPQTKEDCDDILPVQGKKLKRSRLKQKKKRNLITTAAQGAGIKEVDDYNSDTNSKKNKLKNKIPPTLEDNIAAAIPNTSNSINDEFPYKTGEFLAIKSELNQDWPAIWRVDGKALLQKYEPFKEDGITLYRSISTYTSWTPESQKQYISIPIKYKSQSHGEVNVEFLKKEMTIINEEYQQKCIEESEKYQENFEVYIQTLISQALDNNFLTEIFQEKDDYFLLNVKKIDDVTDIKKRKLLNLLRWPSSIQAAVCTWPLFNIIDEINAIETISKQCAACGKIEISVRVLMYGQPYNSTTLEGCQPDPKAMNEKNFLMCRICSKRVELANKVTHQKYLMYIECAKRVSEKRTSDPNKDTTFILNELLADEDWLNKLFYEVRTTWAEIDCIEHDIKLKNS